MKTKIILSGLTVLFFALVTTSFANHVPVHNSMFADVELAHENYNAIYYLKNTGVIQGYSVEDAKIPDYKPGTNINRAEFLKIVMEGNEIELAADYESCFPDVPGHEWFTGYVCKAKEEGWINGYPDGKFKPEQTINEVEAVKILAEVLDWEKPELNENAQWYDYYLQPAEEKKIVPNEDINAKMTRGDIAELVFRNSLVNELDVAFYDEKWEPNLFEKEEIPLTGQLGPGGIFGPGGPLGASGAFVDGGVFDQEKGKVELIPESYFKDNFCYFSNEGEFSGDNLAFLKDYTKEDLDKYVTGAIIDEFGQMFCYSGIAATDLQLFDEQMREEFDILCWREPDFASKETDGWDEILCWARQRDDLEILPVNEKLGLSIELVDLPDFAVDPDASQVEILRFKVNSLGGQEGGISGLDLQNYGQNDPYVIDQLLVKDNNENIYFNDRIYITDWNKDVLTLDFDAPLIVNPEQELLLSVYADLSWEDHNGDLQIGFANLMLSNKVLSFVGESILGAIVGLEEEVPAEDLEEQFCNLSPEGKRTIGSENAPPDVVEVNEGMHLVVPITQTGDTCAAAASYSSLRWLEEKLGIDYLVENGEVGYKKLIKLFYEDAWTLTAQYKDFKKYINDNFKGCLKADYKTVDWVGGNHLTCEELKRYYSDGCDIPLGLRCTNPGDYISWGHRVDIVDVQIDAENPHKCQIIFANSQTPNMGETAGPDDPDGLGYGAYQRGDYDDTQNKFDIKAPWGKGLPCTLYGAMYVCVEDEELCKNNPDIIQLPEEE